MYPGNHPVLSHSLAKRRISRLNNKFIIPSQRPFPNLLVVYMYSVVCQINSILSWKFNSDENLKRTISIPNSWCSSKKSWMKARLGNHIRVRDPNMCWMPSRFSTRKIITHLRFYYSKRWFPSSSSFLTEETELFWRIVSRIVRFVISSPLWYSYHFLREVPPCCPFLACWRRSSRVCTFLPVPFTNRWVEPLPSSMQRRMVCISSSTQRFVLLITVYM